MRPDRRRRGLRARAGRPVDPVREAATAARAPLHAHVRVVRHADPARERPVTAPASVQLAGTPVHVHVEAANPREAADLLVDRLDRRIARRSRTRRGDRVSACTAHLDTKSNTADGRRRLLPVAPPE
jgi:ribosome-associated translation inhibitor RaiA